MSPSFNIFSYFGGHHRKVAWLEDCGALQTWVGLLPLSFLTVDELFYIFQSSCYIFHGAVVRIRRDHLGKVARLSADL